MNVLLIKHGALGDFVLAIGLMRAIAERHPGARFTLMTGRAFLPIAKQMDLFENYIIDDRLPYLSGDVLRVLRETVAGNFDRIYDVQGSSRTRKKYFFLLRWLMPRSFVWVNAYYGNEVHVKKSRPLGWGRTRREPIADELYRTTDLSFLHGDNQHFGELPARFVLMIPGCSPQHPYKRWPTSSFAELACRLASRRIGSVLIGTNDEADALAEIAGATPLVVNMCNRTSLLDVPDLARRAVAVVGNDTGPSHMASLAGAPTIALFDYRTRQGAMRGPRSQNIVSDGEIARIAVDDVWERLLPLLGGDPQPPAPEAAAP